MCVEGRSLDAMVRRRYDWASVCGDPGCVCPLQGGCVKQSATEIWAEKDHPLNTSSDLSSSSASSALVALDVSLSIAKHEERRPTQGQYVPKIPEFFRCPFDRVLRSTLNPVLAFQGQRLSKWRVQARQ